MLLEHEKNGNIPARLARATAFLECASILDRLADHQFNNVARREFRKAADSFRDKAVEERKAHDAQTTYDYDNAPTDPHHGGKLTAEMVAGQGSITRG
jgi:hypothetical protein